MILAICLLVECDILLNSYKIDSVAALLERSSFLFLVANQ